MSVPSASSDHNLLFGILALQVNFVTRDALIAGMNAWVLAKHRPLGEILVEQGVLRQDLHDALEVMVRKHLELHDHDAQKSLAALSSVSSVRRDLEQVADAEVQASIRHVASTTRGEADSWRTEDHGRSPLLRNLRYRRLRPHARGGLGEVFVALDEELNREVALKEIQDQHADHDDSRARFLLEAEITGKLEHPGVVPVYGLGTYPDGRPFYAMRFIKGDSLKEAIARFHGPQAQGLQPLGFHSLAFRQLLGRFVDVCDAVAYAHARGVLHRDLKPGNVMLGRYGETLVVDWGLAKILGWSDEAGSNETTVLTASASGDAMPTEVGQAVGTPQYMSPEQASGKLDLLGPASDVYSLGATLYCLLTGRPPFPAAGAEGVGALLRKVERGDFLPLRGVKPEVPRPLEAVCLKAMSRRPQDRYASVEALAGDVQQWLAGEPVTAWPEPVSVKMGRWVRKNRVLAASAAAALVVALVLGSGGTVWVQQRKEQERRERLARQERASDQADTGLKQAAELRDGYRFKDAQAMLEQVRGWAAQAEDGGLDARIAEAQADLDLARDLDDIRQKALAAVDGRWDPDRVRGEYAEVFVRHGLAVLEGELDVLAEKIRASAVRESIVAALDDWAYREVDHSRKQRVLALANHGDLPDRWRHAVREAVALGQRRQLRQFVHASGEGIPTAGVIRLLIGSMKEDKEKSIAILRQMQRARPRDLWISFTLGKYLYQEKKFDEAAACFLTVVALRADCSVAHNNLGLALKSKGQLDEAIACIKRAIDYASNNAKAHNNLGVAMEAKGQLDEAITCYKRAIACDPKYALAHTNLGLALKAKG
jgi:serine/threonine protein kinase/tetratricopeptide (TPR) repeat protein